MAIFPPASVDAPPVARVCGVRIPKPTVLLPSDHWGFQVFFLRSDDDDDEEERCRRHEKPQTASAADYNPLIPPLSSCPAAVNMPV